MNFEDPKALIGVVGFTVGIAEVFGAALMLGIGQKIVNRFGRDPLVVTTFLLHTTGYLMSYLVFPDDCPVGETNGIVFVNSRMMAVAAAFLLGLGDAIFMTALFSLVNKLFGGTVNTAPAFALATFMQSLTSGASFFYAGILLQ